MFPNSEVSNLMLLSYSILVYITWSAILYITGSKGLDYYARTGDFPFFVFRKNLVLYTVWKSFPFLIPITLWGTLLFNKSDGAYTYLNLSLAFVILIQTNLLDMIMHRRYYNSYTSGIVIKLIHLVLACVALILGAIGIPYLYSIDLLEFIRPDSPINGITNEVWGALVAALIVFYVKRFINNNTLEKELWNSISYVRSNYHLCISSFSKKNNADEHLVMAVACVENMNRPKWFRVMEKLKSYILPKGTYGIMQIYSDKWLSDQESIRKAVEEKFKGTGFNCKNPSWKESYDDILAEYNASIDYPYHVHKAYGFLVRKNS